ncbi:hypothetical protein LINGRAHAP2_LOCUS34096 [Linum grandiflorum]
MMIVRLRVRSRATRAAQTLPRVDQRHPPHHHPPPPPPRPQASMGTIPRGFPRAFLPRNRGRGSTGAWPRTSRCSASTWATTASPGTKSPCSTNPESSPCLVNLRHRPRGSSISFLLPARIEGTTIILILIIILRRRSTLCMSMFMFLPPITTMSSPPPPPPQLSRRK